MKRLVYLATAALVALMILVPVAAAQDMTVMQEKETTMTAEGLPKSGGPGLTSVLMPAAALLVGSGVLAYAVLRRR